MTPGFILRGQRTLIIPRLNIREIVPVMFHKLDIVLPLATLLDG